MSFTTQAWFLSVDIMS